MAPMSDYSADDTTPFILAISFLILIASIVILVTCACCRKQEEKREKVAPDMPKEDKISPPTEQQTEKNAEEIRETEPPQQILKTPLLSSLKHEVVAVPDAQKQPEQMPVKTAKEETKVSRKKRKEPPLKSQTVTVEPSTSSIQSVPQSSRPTITQTTVISTVTSGDTTRGGRVPLAKAEPSYPLGEAVEFENPAYRTIHSGMEDPFRMLATPVKEPKFVVAKLVESRQSTVEPTKFSTQPLYIPPQSSTVGQLSGTVGLKSQSVGKGSTTTTSGYGSSTFTKPSSMLFLSKGHPNVKRSR